MDRCYRYYQSIAELATYVLRFDGIRQSRWWFKKTMRAAPTVAGNMDPDGAGVSGTFQTPQAGYVQLSFGATDSTNRNPKATSCTATAEF